MNLTFNVCDLGNKKIRIQDFTQDGDEYIPESLPDTKYAITRYFNYKYSETCTINILQYNSSTEQSIYSTTYTDHNSYLDEDIVTISKDGYYTLYHIVLPTVLWLNNRLQDSKFDLSTYSSIYVTDCEYIYKVINNSLEKCDEKEITLINTYNTTISRCEKNLFYFYDLYNCYIGTCNDIFNKSVLRCPNNSQNLKETRYNRDFIWSAINVMRFYIDNNQYESALLLLEKLDSCNGFCKLLTRNELMSKCRCS